MISRPRLEYATRGFLAACRKEAAKLSPGEPAKMGQFDDYPEAQRTALMIAVKAAILLAGPEADAAFDKWLLTRNKE